MNEKKTYLCASLQLIWADSLKPYCHFDLGVVERVSQAEKLRSLIAENNEQYLVLLDIVEKVNSNYSPLDEALKNSDSKID